MGQRDANFRSISEFRPPPKKKTNNLDEMNDSVICMTFGAAEDLLFTRVSTTCNAGLSFALLLLLLLLGRH
jgi:hypothetical protein